MKCQAKFAAVLALGALAGVSAGSARALTPLQIPYLVHPGTPIPSDGALLIADGEVALVSLVVRDAAGVEVPGELLDVVEGFRAFRPLYPLLPGQRYTVEIEGEGFGGSMDAVEVEAAWFPLPLTPQSAGDVYVDESTETLCCNALDGDDEHCFDRSLTRSARVYLGMRSDEPASHLNQFVYQIEGESGWDAFLPRRWVSVEAEGERHCYQIRARHIVLGTEILWPEVCVDVGPLPPLGQEVFDVDADFSVDRCEVPPHYWEDEWCEVNRGVCVGGDVPACADYGERCDGFSLTRDDVGGAAADPAADEELPPSGDDPTLVAGAARGEASGAAGGAAPALDGTGEGAGSEPGADAAGRSRAGGCNVARGRSTGLGVWMALAWLARRRGRRMR